MKKKKQALSRFNDLVTCIYEWHLSKNNSNNLEVLTTIELVESYLLFLQSKSKKIKSDARKEIKNFTQNENEKQSLEAFYNYIERLM